MNEENNIKSHRYPFLFDQFICPRDDKDMAVKELYDAIAATRESLIAKKKNPNHFQMKQRTKKDSCQRIFIPNNRGNPSVKWNEEGFVFWTTKGTGLVKAYNKKELQKLHSA